MEKKEKEKTLKLLLLIPQYSVIAAPCSEFLSDNSTPFYVFSIFQYVVNNFLKFCQEKIHTISES